jgi:hypothetical protein
VPGGEALSGDEDSSVGEEQFDEPPSLLFADERDERKVLANLIFCSALLRILSTCSGWDYGWL